LTFRLHAIIFQKVKLLITAAVEYLSPSFLVVLHTRILAEKTYLHSAVGNLAAYTLIRYAVPLSMNFPVHPTPTSAA
jgi:hypothetical protein